MNKVLVTWASTHGQTEKIARRMAEQIESRGLTTEIRKVAENPDPGDFEAVLAGASLHGGKHQTELTEWIKQHHDTLAARPGGFFSVSLTAAEKTPEEREPAVKIMRECLADFDWEPELTATIAGALLYREYDRFTRTLIKLMMKRGGHPSDSSRDYEYTDWDMVDEFARRFASAAGAKGPGRESAAERR